MTTRQPRKPGLYERQISAQRNSRAIAMHRQVADVQAAYGTRKDFTKVPVGYMHPEIREALREHTDWGRSRLVSIFQGDRLTYTENGDFTHLSGRGI